MIDQSAFAHRTLPSRIIFGAGSLRHVPREVEALGGRRVLVLTSPSHAETANKLEADLGGRFAALFSAGEAHVPENVATEALTKSQGAGADLLLAIGGGSVTGLAKAIARRTSLPILAVPTTYAGSEVTPIWGTTGLDGKSTGRDAKVLPQTVVYDSDLTLALPVGLSVCSGLNALAHAVEGLYAQDANPVSSLLAAEGVEAIVRALPEVVADPTGRVGRDRLLYGSWLCGTVLGQVGMALHHQLCHVLGGRFGLPHAQTHAVLLPHVVAYNESSAASACARIATLLRAGRASTGIFALRAAVGAPTSLRQLGLRRGDLRQVVVDVIGQPYWNPRKVDATSLLDLLERAYAGAR